MDDFTFRKIIHCWLVFCPFDHRFMVTKCLIEPFSHVIICYPNSCSNNAIPSPCTKGTFSPSGQLTCGDCEKGHQCPTDLMSSQIPCTDGTYQDTEKSEECLPCPAGSQCTSASVAPAPCSAGMYSVRGMKECLHCPAGFR